MKMNTLPVEIMKRNIKNININISNIKINSNKFYYIL